MIKSISPIRWVCGLHENGFKGTSRDTEELYWVLGNDGFTCMVFNFERSAEEDFHDVWDVIAEVDSLKEAFDFCVEYDRQKGPKP